MAIHEPYHETRREDRPVELNAVEARQGFTGRPVLMVLVTALVLAMLAWAVAGFWGMSIDEQTPADNAQVTAPATEPAAENENVVNNNAPAGEETEQAPAIIDPTPPANE